MKCSPCQEQDSSIIKSSLDHSSTGTNKIQDLTRASRQPNIYSSYLKVDFCTEPSSFSHKLHTGPQQQIHLLTSEANILLLGHKQCMRSQNDP